MKRKRPESREDHDLEWSLPDGRSLIAFAIALGARSLAPFAESVEAQTRLPRRGADGAARAAGEAVPHPVSVDGERRLPRRGADGAARAAGQ